jgi:hypothetical protein
MSKLDYKIPKIEAKVDILIDDETTSEAKEYILFLDEFSRYRKGKETLYEFLNKKKEKEFIPLKNFNSGEFIILKLDDIVYVKEKEIYSHQSFQEVVLSLRNNIQLEVGHFNPLPDSQSRVLDYLNQEVQFILFYHDERKIFVNKNKIIRVKER